MVAPSADAPTGGAGRIAGALLDASGTGLLALGLSFPILALRTDQNMSNQLVLGQRWGYVAIAVALAFGARLAYLLAPSRPPPRLHRAAAETEHSALLTRVLTIVGAALLVAYPFVVILLAGRT